MARMERDENGRLRYGPVFEARAWAIIEALNPETGGGPADIETLTEAMGVSRDKFRDALHIARNYICPDLGLAIPYDRTNNVYSLTPEFIDLEAEADVERWSTERRSDALTRIDTILKGVQIASNALDGRTKEGRLARFTVEVYEGARRQLRAAEELLA